MLSSRLLRILQGGGPTGDLGGKQKVTFWENGNLQDSGRPLPSFPEGIRNRQLLEKTEQPSCRGEISRICQLPACCAESSRLAAFVSRHSVGFSGDAAVFESHLLLLSNPSPILLLVSPIKTH